VIPVTSSLTVHTHLLRVLHQRLGDVFHEVFQHETPFSSRPAVAWAAGSHPVMACTVRSVPDPCTSRPDDSTQELESWPRVTTSRRNVPLLIRSWNDPGRC